MKNLILISLMFYLSTSGARDPSEKFPQYVSEGQMIVVRVVPADKTAKLFLLGRKSLDLDFKKEGRILSVYLNDKTTETLRINSKGDYYEVEGLPEATPFDLNVRAEVRGKIDDVKVRVLKRNP